MRITFSAILILNCFTCLSQDKQFREFRPGELSFKLAIPYINHIALHPDKLFRESKFGFIGEALGFEYNYKKNKFLETIVSLNATADIPIPVPIDKEYRKFISTMYFSLTDNFVKNRFTFGYGINYAFNKWKEQYNNEIMIPVEETEYINKTLGITLNCTRLGKTVNIGLIYRPSLFILNDGFDLIYEHLISIDFSWQFRIIKGRKE
jgi:hypothetical protein